MIGGTCLQRAFKASEIGHNGVTMYARAVTCGARARSFMKESGETRETGGDLDFEPVKIRKAFSDGLEKHGDVVREVRRTGLVQVSWPVYHRMAPAAYK